MHVAPDLNLDPDSVYYLLRYWMEGVIGGDGHIARHKKACSACSPGLPDVARIRGAEQSLAIWNARRRSQR